MITQQEDLDRKLECLQYQKQEIVEETKKLELLTLNYEDLLRKELKLEAVAGTIAQKERDLTLREERID